MLFINNFSRHFFNICLGVEAGTGASLLARNLVLCVFVSMDQVLCCDHGPAVLLLS